MNKPSADWVNGFRRCEECGGFVVRDTKRIGKTGDGRSLYEITLECEGCGNRTRYQQAE